jgi:hypothetical protein
MNKPAFPQPSENPPSHHIAPSVTFNSPPTISTYGQNNHCDPLPDKFFTYTLFAQDSVLATLTTPATRLSFFSRDNASVIGLVGADISFVANISHYIAMNPAPDFLQYNMATLCFRQHIFNRDNWD